MYNSPVHVQIAAIDYSFIPKSKKKTFGIDKFWSGVHKTAPKGLEISAISLINVFTGIDYKYNHLENLSPNT